MPSHSPILKHAVLRVRFASAGADCADANSQLVAPDEALVRLREGDAWAALLSSGHDVRELSDWIMVLRHQPGGRLPGVLALLPDVADPGALAALRAGADALLQHDSSAALIRTQLARLRERVAPQPNGWLPLDGGLALDGASRHLCLHGNTLALPPQIFHLLWTLAARAGHVLGPQALRLAMDIPARAHADSVHTAVGRLRRMLRPLGLEARLQTVHGVGYRWVESGVAQPDSSGLAAAAPAAKAAGQ